MYILELPPVYFEIDFMNAVACMNVQNTQSISSCAGRACVCVPNMTTSSRISGWETLRTDVRAA